MRPTVLIMAGEPSGDQHAAELARELRVRHPDVRLLGTGGARMEAEGVELLAGLRDLAVMGFVEILPKILFFKRLQGRIERLLDAERPDVVVLVDYPGFNLRVAKAAHSRGLRVLYYIPPKVWAWREGRAARLAAHTDRVASILPFEVDLLERYGADVVYVGNPLLDGDTASSSRAQFCEAWGLDPDRVLLAVLPGSRTQELRHHLEPFRAIVERVVAARPDVTPVFSRAPEMPAHPFHDLGFPVVTGTGPLLEHAAVALVKSGTGTLETAIAGTPHVIAYRASAITYQIGRRVMRTEYVGLPNLIAGEGVFPEVLQYEVAPEVVAPLLLELLDERSEARRLQLRGIEQIRERLGAPGASGRVADMVSQLLTEPTA